MSNSVRYNKFDIWLESEARVICSLLTGLCTVEYPWNNLFITCRQTCIGLGFIDAVRADVSPDICTLSQFLLHHTASCDIFNNLFLEELDNWIEILPNVFFVSPGEGSICLKSILQVAQLVRQGVDPCLPNAKHHHDIQLPKGVMSAVCKYISKSKVKPMGIVSGWRRYIIRGMFASE